MGQNRQIMPGIVNGAVPPEVTLMFPDDLFAAADDHPARIGAHLHRAPRRPGHDRVAVAVEADEAGAGDGMLALMEAIEGRQDRLQDRPLHLQRLGHGDIAALGMGVVLGPAPALRLPSHDLAFEPFEHGIFCHHGRRRRSRQHRLPGQHPPVINVGVTTVERAVGSSSPTRSAHFSLTSRELTANLSEFEGESDLWPSFLFQAAPAECISAIDVFCKSLLASDAR